MVIKHTHNLAAEVTEGTAFVNLDNDYRLTLTAADRLPDLTPVEEPEAPSTYTADVQRDLAGRLGMSVNDIDIETSTDSVVIILNDMTINNDSDIVKMQSEAEVPMVLGATIEVSAKVGYYDLYDVLSEGLDDLLTDTYAPGSFYVNDYSGSGSVTVTAELFFEEIEVDVLVDRNGTMLDTETVEDEVIAHIRSTLIGGTILNLQSLEVSYPPITERRDLFREQVNG